MNITQAQAIERFGLDVETGIELDSIMPVLTTPQPQGDVIAIPSAILGYEVEPATGIVPAEGIAVVRGENGGNTHLLLPSPGIAFDERSSATQRLLLGVLTVDPDAEAVLHHPEHGYSAIGAGTYEIRRQREQADEIVLVRD